MPMICSSIQITRTSRTIDRLMNKEKGTMSHVSGSFSLSQVRHTKAIIVNPPKHLMV